MDELIKAVKENESGYFTRVPGLGKKTAMKIILELSQRLQSEFKLEKMYLSDDDKTVVDALVSLGFKSNEARNILSKLPKNLSLEEKIKAGLKLGLWRMAGKEVNYTYNEQNREGDHICYISNLRKLKKEYPSWRITKDRDTIFKEMVGAELAKIV